MSSINFAVVGCGRIGFRHAEHINYKGKLVAVCDTDKLKRTELSEKYGAKVFESLDELLNSDLEIDVISI